MKPNEMSLLSDLDGLGRLLDRLFLNRSLLLNGSSFLDGGLLDGSFLDGGLLDGSLLDGGLLNVLGLSSSNDRGGLSSRCGQLGGLNIGHGLNVRGIDGGGLESSSGRGPLGLVLVLAETFVVVTLQSEELLEVGLFCGKKRGTKRQFQRQFTCHRTK